MRLSARWSYEHFGSNFGRNSILCSRVTVLPSTAGVVKENMWRKQTSWSFTCVCWMLIFQGRPRRRSYLEEVCECVSHVAFMLKQMGCIQDVTTSSKYCNYNDSFLPTAFYTYNSFFFRCWLCGGREMRLSLLCIRHVKTRISVQGRRALLVSMASMEEKDCHDVIRCLASV